MLEVNSSLVTMLGLAFASGVQHGMFLGLVAVVVGYCCGWAKKGCERLIP